MQVSLSRRPITSTVPMSEMRQGQLGVVIAHPRGHRYRYEKLVIAVGPSYFYIPSRNDHLSLEEAEKHTVRLIEPGELVILSN